MNTSSFEAVALSFGIQKEQKPYTGTNGMYCWRDVVPGDSLLKALAFAAQRLGIPLDPDNMHVTCMYSKLAVPFNELVLDSEPCQAKVVGVTSWRGHDEEGYLVLEVQSDTLSSRHALFTEQGAKSSFPDYQPHITLITGYPGNDNETGKRCAGIENLGLTVTLSGEKVADLKHDVSKMEDKTAEAAMVESVEVEEAVASGVALAAIAIDQTALTEFLRCATLCTASWEYTSPDGSKTLQPDAKERAYFVKKLALSESMFTALGLLKEFRQLQKISVAAGRDFSFTLNAMYELMGSVKGQVLVLRTAQGPTAYQLKFLGNCIKYIVDGSSTAASFLCTKYTLLRSPEINAMMFKGEQLWWGSDTQDSKNTNRILEIVTELGGKYFADMLTFNEQKAIRTSGDSGRLALLSEYLALVKEDIATFKTELKKLVEGSGKDTLDTAVVLKAMHGLGVERTTIPKGFDGRIDSQGRFYTRTGAMLEQGTLPPQVTMNPNWAEGSEARGTSYYCSGFYPDNIKPATGKIALVHVYAVTSVQRRAEKKSEKIGKAEKLLPRIQAAWRKLMKSNDGQEKMLGCLLEFMFRTNARVGTLGAESAGKATYGAVTILVKHVKITTAFVQVAFPSKSDGFMKFTFPRNSSDPYIKILAGEIVELVQVPGKDQDTPVWKLTGDKTSEPMSYVAVNTFLKQYSGLTSHIFRSLNGTQLARKELDREQAYIKPVPDLTGLSPAQQAAALSKYEKQVLEAYLSAISRVSELLGHFSATGVSSTTAIKSYVDQQVTRDFFAKNDCVLPEKIANLLSDSKV